MTMENQIYQLKPKQGIMRRLMTFLNISNSSDVNSNITDVTNSPADWEDFWYNEDGRN